MNEQPTFADLDCQHKKRRTRREEFLERMDALIPWRRLEERIGPHYFRGERGRRPYPLSAMLRIHIVQLCYNLSDPAMEDLLHGGERQVWGDAGYIGVQKREENLGLADAEAGAPH